MQFRELIATMAMCGKADVTRGDDSSATSIFVGAGIDTDKNRVASTVRGNPTGQFNNN